MNFDIGDSRRLLAESLSRLLSDRGDIAARNRVAHSTPWHDPETWAALTDLGLFHAFLPEEAGGFGGTGADVMCVFEVLGRHLSPEPVLGQLMAARALAALGAKVASALTGQVRWALAVGEPDAPYDLADSATAARDTAMGWRLSGRKSVVYGGGTAERLLIAAHSPTGIGLFEIAAADAEITAYGMIDGGGAAEVILEDTPADCLAEDAAPQIEEALDWGRLALAAEAVGAMEAATALMQDYLRTRQQFGRPIGTFQALQHRAVDLAIEIEQARSITIRAATAMADEDRARAVSMAKSLVGRVAKHVAEETIQMQGGIAMTWDYASAHYAKRLVMIDAQLGDSDFHLARLSAILADPAGA